MESIIKRVAYILEQVPEARHNDNLLLITYWRLYDSVEKVNEALHATKAESILRTRRIVLYDMGLNNITNKEDTK